MIKIFAVDDDDRFLDALVGFFEPFPNDYNLVGRFSDVGDKDGVENLLDTIEYSKPEIVLMDFDFHDAGRPHDFGIELTKLIQTKIPGQKVIMFTKDSPSTNEEVLKKVKRSFQAGATAYMRKDEPRTWLECINETAIGVYSDKAIPEVVVKMLIDRLRAPLLYRLTDREIKALNLLAEDKRVNEIAEAMGIGFSGANFHLDNVKIKLEAKTLHGLVAKSLRAGLIW